MAALCIAQPVSALSIDSKGSTLDRPIAESPGSYLPQVCINIQRAFSKKRIRSFGDFQNLISDDTDSVNTRYLLTPKHHLPAGADISVSKQWFQPGGCNRCSMLPLDKFVNSHRQCLSLRDSIEKMKILMNSEMIALHCMIESECHRHRFSRSYLWCYVPLCWMIVVMLVSLLHLLLCPKDYKT